jgi:hypothetical protein
MKKERKKERKSSPQQTKKKNKLEFFFLLDYMTRVFFFRSFSFSWIFPHVSFHITWYKIVRYKRKDFISIIIAYIENKYNN